MKTITTLILLSALAPSAFATAIVLSDNRTVTHDYKYSLIGIHGEDSQTKSAPVGSAFNETCGTFSTPWQANAKQTSKADGTTFSSEQSVFMGYTFPDLEHADFSLWTKQRAVYDVSFEVTELQFFKLSFVMDSRTAHNGVWDPWVAESLQLFAPWGMIQDGTQGAGSISPGTSSIEGTLLPGIYRLYSESFLEQKGSLGTTLSTEIRSQFELTLEPWHLVPDTASNLWLSGLAFTGLIVVRRFKERAHLLG